MPRRFVVLRDDNIPEVSRQTGRSEVALLQLYNEMKALGRTDVKIPLPTREPLGVYHQEHRVFFCPRCDRPFLTRWRMEGHLRKAHKKYFKTMYGDEDA